MSPKWRKEVGVGGRRARQGRNDQDQLCNPPPLPTPHLLALFSIPPREAQQLRPPSPGPFTADPLKLQLAKLVHSDQRFLFYHCFHQEKYSRTRPSCSLGMGCITGTKTLSLRDAFSC
ncbi:hypothetical protein V6N13_071668 [Hibiscus sabdariffa]